MNYAEFAMMLNVSIYSNFFLLIILVVVFLFMKSEGRFFLTRSFSGKGIDLLIEEPESRAITLKALKFDGEYFWSGKERLYFNFDPLLNPGDKDTNAYNELLKQACHWKGSKRPVVMASEMVSFISNPHLLATLEQSKDNDGYNKVKTVIENLKKTLGENVVRIRFLQAFTPQVLREFLNSGSTPSKNVKLHERGRLAGKLEMTRQRDFSTIKKIAIPLGILLLILLLWSQGVFDNLLNTFR
jgi:hypothetical protein